MPITKTEPDDYVWSVRGIPEPLVQKVKQTARQKGMNIGKVVEMSLKKFFEEEAMEVLEDSYYGNRISELETRLDMLEKQSTSDKK